MTSRFFQHIKTSSKSRGGYVTFQVTEGLNTAVMKRLESNLNYKAPQLSGLDMAQYPLFFGHLRVEGQHVFSRMQYLGQDRHSGRAGNFICHNLVQQDKTSFSPVLLFKYFPWKTELTIEEDSSKTPYSIESAAFSDDSKHLNADWINQLGDFFNSGNRLNALAYILDLLVGYQTVNNNGNQGIDLEVGILNTDYKILIEEEHPYLLNWFLALASLFPPKLSHAHVTFASFINDNNFFLAESSRLIGIPSNSIWIAEFKKRFLLAKVTVNSRQFNSYQIQNEYTRLIIDGIASGKLAQTLTQIFRSLAEKPIEKINRDLNQYIAFSSELTKLFPSNTQLTDAFYEKFSQQKNFVEDAIIELIEAESFQNAFQLIELRLKEKISSIPNKFNYLLELQKTYFDHNSAFSDSQLGHFHRLAFSTLNGVPEILEFLDRLGPSNLSDQMLNEVIHHLAGTNILLLLQNEVVSATRAILKRYSLSLPDSLKKLLLTVMEDHRRFHLLTDRNESSQQPEAYLKELAAIDVNNDLLLLIAEQVKKDNIPVLAIPDIQFVAHNQNLLIHLYEQVFSMHPALAHQATPKHLFDQYLRVLDHPDSPDLLEREIYELWSKLTAKEQKEASRVLVSHPTSLLVFRKLNGMIAETIDELLGLIRQQNPVDVDLLLKEEVLRFFGRPTNVNSDHFLKIYGEFLKTKGQFYFKKSPTAAELIEAVLKDCHAKAFENGVISHAEWKGTYPVLTKLTDLIPYLVLPPLVQTSNPYVTRIEKQSAQIQQYHRKTDPYECVKQIIQNCIGVGWDVHDWAIALDFFLNESKENKLDFTILSCKIETAMEELENKTESEQVLVKMISSELIIYLIIKDHVGFLKCLLKRPFFRSTLNKYKKFIIDRSCLYALGIDHTKLKGFLSGF